MGAEHEEVIRRWFRAWEGHGDPAELVSYMAPDGRFYGNRNWPPHEGRARIKQWWDRMLDGPAHDTRVDVLHVASEGNTVFIERIDTAVRNGNRWWLPILGVGEVDEAGLVSEWRDYFGATSNYAAANAGPPVRALMADGRDPHLDPLPRAPVGERAEVRPGVTGPEAEAVVRKYIEAWNGTPDADELASFFSERAFFYPNRDWSPYRGREAIASHWRALAVRGVRVEVLHVASVGNTVFVERTDHFTRTDTGETVETPVAGAGEVDENGRIANWRDYFPTTPPPDVLP